MNIFGVNQLVLVVDFLFGVGGGGRVGWNRKIERIIKSYETMEICGQRFFVDFFGTMNLLKYMNKEATKEEKE